MYVCVFGEMSLVKAGSLYAYYNAMLIQRINFLDMYVCVYVCMYVYLEKRHSKKAGSLYAYYNAMLNQSINFFDMYVCMYGFVIVLLKPCLVFCPRKICLKLMD